MTLDFHRYTCNLVKKYQPKRSMEELIAMAGKRLGLEPALLRSRSRQKKYSQARAIFSYLAVEETGYSAAEVARCLGVARMSVHEAVSRGKTLCSQAAR